MDLTGSRRRIVLWQGAALLALLVAVASFIATRTSSRSSSSASAIESNPALDGGTSLSGPAPAFTLTDQLGRRVSLASMRGHVVLLAFNDPLCTTICPLTTTEMLDAKRMLGSAGSQVRLLGVDANPTATAVKDVRAYSQAHGMMHAWSFLTGSLAQLRRVWSAYHIEAQVEHGQIDHTPALYVIGPTGDLAKLYLTELAYAGVRQQAQIVAEAAATLIPGHPVVRSDLSYAAIPSIGPTSTVSLPGANGAGVSLGPSGAPRLLLFFDTWDSEVTALASNMQALGGYSAIAASAPVSASTSTAASAPAAASLSTASSGGLPALTAIDEASVEPSTSALPDFLGSLSRPLPYPVAIDQTGRVADGYGVEDEPWLELVSGSGRILWHYDVSTSGWLSTSALVRQMRAALASAPIAPASLGVALKALAGSPAPLAALHAQASLLVGTQSALMARLRSLRGYPVVLNVWASWCPPCKSEFPLFASASARYGRRVAFLGADAEDQAGEASSFLRQHPVSYPSYEVKTEALSSLAAIPGLPTTIFISPSGKVVHVHIGQYGAQGTLDEDIDAYARAG